MKIVTNCKGNKDCSCSCKKQQVMYTYSSETEGTVVVERVTIDGVEYLKAPVSMMVPGERFGANQDEPFIYSAQALRRSANDWEGIPVTLGHPVDNDGTMVTAAHESATVIGKLESPRFEKNSLRAVAVFNALELELNHPDVYEALTTKQPIEVSIGLFCSVEKVSKNDNKIQSSQDYDLVVAEIIPDHLAVLMNEEGACSWSDGCGIRINKIKEMEKMSKLQLVISHLAVNALSFSETAEKVRTLIAEKLNGNSDEKKSWVYLDEMYPDKAIFSMDDGNGKYKCYEQGYSLGENEVVTLQGDWKEVTRKITYVPVESEQVTEEVTEAAPANNEESNTTAEESETTVTNMDEMKDEEIISNKKVIVAIQNEISKRTEFLGELVGNQLRDDINTALALLKEKRQSVIKAITSNSKFTETMLLKKDMQELELLADALASRNDYSLQTQGIPLTANQENKQTQTEESLLPVLP